MQADQALRWLQIAVSILTLGGVAFATGRLYGRIDTIHTTVTKMSDALFGVDGGKGAFISRIEADLLREGAMREHAEFDNRLTDLARRLGAVETRSRRTA